MAFITAFSQLSWGSGPVIKTDLLYDQERVGTKMRYKFKVSCTIASASYFYYDITAKCYLDDHTEADTTFTVKTSSTKNGTFSKESDWVEIEKPSGSTKLRWVVSSSSGRTSLDRSINTEVVPGGSVFGVIPDFNFEDGVIVPVTKYSQNFIDTLSVFIGNVAIKTMPNFITGTVVTFTTDELLNIYSAMINTTDVVTFRLTTNSGDTIVGSSTQTANGSIAGAIHINVSGEFKRGIPWYNDNGTWKRCIIHVNNNGRWVRGV